MPSVSIRELRFKSAPGRVEGSQIRAQVETLHPLRQREYATGHVFNVTLVDEAGDRIRLFLYDAWATALTFVATGDWLTVKTAFGLVLSPEVGPSLHTTLVGYPEREVFLTTEHDTVLVVEQKADHGDVLELVIDERHLELPVARVKRPPLDSLVISTSPPTS